MHLLLGDDGVGIQARQTGVRCEGQAALAGVEDVLALLAELADLRSGAPLVPSSAQKQRVPCELFPYSLVKERGAAAFSK